MYEHNTCNEYNWATQCNEYKVTNLMYKVQSSEYGVHKERVQCN